MEQNKWNCCANENNESQKWNQW